MAQRTCQSCGTSFPDGKEHFPSKKSASQCRLCYRKNRSLAKKRVRARRREMLADIERAGVDLFGKVTTTGGSNIPHSAEVLERVFQYFGGVAGFSSVLVKQYWDSPAGGSARNRLIETIVRLVSKNVEQGGAKRPLTLWTEDELESELSLRIAQAMSTYKGITVNAKAFPAPEDTGVASDPDAAEPDGVPEGGDQNPPERDQGSSLGGFAAVPTDTLAAISSPEPSP